MKISTFFMNNGVPATGLSATISIWKFDGTQVVTDQAMTEIAGGFYFYDYADYNEDEDYVMVSDGSDTLDDYERYAYQSNGTAGVGNILKIEKNKWEIKSNQMIFYDDDGVTELYKFDLKTKSGYPTEKDVFSRSPE